MSLSFAPHSRVGEHELVSPFHAVQMLLAARLGKETKDEDASHGSPLYKAIGDVVPGLQGLLHERCRSGELTALVHPAGDQAVYRVPREHWRDAGELEGGFHDDLFCWANSAVPVQYRDAPVFYPRLEVERIAADADALAAIAPAIPLGNRSAPRPGPDPARALRELLPVFEKYDEHLSNLASDRARHRFMQKKWPLHARSLGREKCHSYAPFARAWASFKA